MKRFAWGAVLLALGTWSAEARVMLENSPLKPLCDQLCGGIWQEEDASDGTATTYRFFWDEEAGLLQGEAISMRGEDADTREKVLMLFGKNANDTLWSMRIDEEGPPVYGPMILQPNGYQTRVSPLGTTDEYMITTMTVTDEDEFTLKDEISGKGIAVQGAERRFERKPE